MSGATRRRGPPEAAAGAGHVKAPGTATESPPADLVEVGRVIDAYGVRGWIKIAPFNDPQDSVLRSTRRWWLPDGRRLDVDRVRVHGATIVAHPVGSVERDAAERLKGLTLRVSRADFPSSGQDEVYWIDLVGCRVCSPGGAALGIVQAVHDYGAHPILLLRDDTGRERMIPFVGQWIVEVDLGQRRIVADWDPEF